MNSPDSATNQTPNSDLFGKLNERQQQAATHGQSPLLIIAGAGTGKTTTLAHRVAHLIAEGVDPRRILLLTFTRRASAEMLRRVDGISRELAAQNDSRAALPSRQVWGGTFHAIASRLLRRYGKSIGLDPEFTIVDRSDAADLLGAVRSEFKLEQSESRFPQKGTCLDIYSRCVNSQQRLDDVLKTAFPWCMEHHDALKQIFTTYVDRKELQAILDYDDLLLFWQALVEDPEGAELIRGLFDCVLVDEYQDTNVLQAAILRGICPDGVGLTVVGDDAQSIYSFRAATVQNILEFPQQYAGSTVVALEQNYRSSQPILDATNQVIAQAKHRHVKNLWSQRKTGDPPEIVDCLDDNEQCDFVIDQILEHRERGIALNRQAVLFRASHHSLALEVELSRRNIPFHKYGGLKYIETAHVKDLLAFLRFAENSRDTISGTRVLMLLPGIGPRKAASLMDLLKRSGGDFTAWQDYSPPAAAKDHWPLLVALFRLLSGNQADRQAVPQQVYHVRKFYAPLLEEKYDHATARLRDLEHLELVAGRFENRAKFLDEITLDPPTSTQELPGQPHLDEDYLILSTIHSAKGLEWDAVYVLHIADGNIPSDMSTKNEEEIEEERRLFYVALTRAKSWLYLCFPQRYYFNGPRSSAGDAHSIAQLTRFLPTHILEGFSRRHACGPAESTNPAEDKIDLKTSQIRDRIKTIW